MINNRKMFDEVYYFLSEHSCRWNILFVFVIYYFLMKYKVKLFEFDQIGFLERQSSSIQIKETENLAKKKKKWG